MGSAKSTFCLPFNIFSSILRQNLFKTSFYNNFSYLYFNANNILFTLQVYIIYFQNICFNPSWMYFIVFLRTVGSALKLFGKTKGIRKSWKKPEKWQMSICQYATRYHCSRYFTSSDIFVFDDFIVVLAIGFLQFFSLLIGLFIMGCISTLTHDHGHSTTTDRLNATKIYQGHGHRSVSWPNWSRRRS